MLYYFDESNQFSESDWYDAIRSVVPDPFRHLDEDQLDRVLEQVVKQLPEAEKELVIESIGKIAKSLGKGIVKNAGAIGAVGGAIAGTVIAGPPGTAIGAKLGGALGGVVSGQAGDRGKTKRPNLSRASQHITSSPQKYSQPHIPGLSQHSAGKALMVANHYQFLIQVVQAVIESIVRVLLQKNNTKFKGEETNSHYLPLEDFGNALAVFGAETSKRFSRKADRSTPDNYTEWGPEEQAEAFFAALYPNSK